jgi:DNA-binding cell septation regulator SpoVG
MTKREKKAKISEVTFYPIIPTAKGVVCFTSFTYSNLFKINDCAIVTLKEGGYRIVYPIKTLPNGRVVNVIYPLSAKVGKPIEDFLLTEYEKFIAEKVKD